MTAWKCSDCQSKFYDPKTVLYRVKDALSTPIDMVKMVKQIITKPKGE